MRVTTFQKCLAGAVVMVLNSASVCHAGWFDSNWQYRRAIQIVWDDQNPSGEDLASCVFYTDGHCMPNGEDIRVATEEGRLVASHVLMVGPGDRMRIVFALQKNVRDYQIYFGNLHPQPPPEGMEDVHYKSGLLLETRVWTGGTINDFSDIEKSWDRSKPVLGKTMIDSVFMGYNAFGPQEQWISKFTGSVFAPMEGDYLFAMAVKDAGALNIDGAPIVFAHRGPGDTRYHGTAHLARGRHDLLVYHANFNGDAYVSVGWSGPGMPKMQIISRESFGICYSGLIGAMEQHGKTLVADFSSNLLGECFTGDGYSFEYHFSSKAKVAVTTKVQWDFGDGQSSDLPEVDHVYLVDGIYAVRLTARAGENADTQTCNLAVARNYAHLTDSKQMQPAFLSAILDGYNLNAIQPQSLPRTLLVHLAAGRVDPALAIGRNLAAIKSHPDAAAAQSALLALHQKLLDGGRVDDAVVLWDQVASAADIQPMAARRAAELALWWTGDFEKAAGLLKPFEKASDPQLRRLYAQALLLSGHVEQATKMLSDLPTSATESRKPALSGAAARSVEFFITEKDPQSGEEAWDRWQQRFPTDFLEGYSVALRTRLIALRQRPEAAAKLAQAFAAAVPTSPYAPQLLDSASKLLANIDVARSQELRKILKQKYPEDPLSQN